VYATGDTGEYREVQCAGIVEVAVTRDVKEEEEEEENEKEDGDLGVLMEAEDITPCNGYKTQDGDDVVVVGSTVIFMVT
jgi:hypothetical protein